VSQGRRDREAEAEQKAAARARGKFPTQAEFAKKTAELQSDIAEMARKVAEMDRAADLELMLEEYTQMVRSVMTQCRTEMVTPSGGFADRQVVEKMKALGTMLEAAGDMKIKLAKASRMLSQVLTPEQRMDETRKMVLAHPPLQRSTFIQSLQEGHRAQKVAEGSPPRAGLSPAVEAIQRALTGVGALGVDDD
jgi:23S rRNA A2030 N6-methylase RlmJ